VEVSDEASHWAAGIADHTAGYDRLWWRFELGFDDDSRRERIDIPDIGVCNR
jgi:hypothetical protein